MPSARRSGGALEAAERELDELVERYAHRVQYFTGQIQKRFMLGDRWRDELVSAGYWGLFKALRNRRVDAHERELSAYVSRRIEGAVIDEARSCLSRSARTEAWSGSRLHGLEESEDVECDGGASLAVLGALRACERAAEDDPEQLVSMRLRQSAIDAALGALEPDAREVLRAYMEGDSLSEIARARGVSAGTMQARFDKLARRLRAGAPRLRRILLDAES